MSKRPRKLDSCDLEHMGSRGRCICCGTPLKIETHHRQPKSQNGALEESNEVPVCEAHHSIYHVLCGCGLAKTVKARVLNFEKWMAQFPDAPRDLFGHKGWHNPGKMAPPFVLEEDGGWRLSKMLKFTDYSRGRLSKIDKIKEWKQREFPT